MACVWWNNGFSPVKHFRQIDCLGSTFNIGSIPRHGWKSLQNEINKGNYIVLKDNNNNLYLKWFSYALCINCWFFALLRRLLFCFVSVLRLEVGGQDFPCSFSIQWPDIFFEKNNLKHLYESRYLECQRIKKYMLVHTQNAHTFISASICALIESMPFRMSALGITDIFICNSFQKLQFK